MKSARLRRRPVCRLPCPQGDLSRHALKPPNHAPKIARHKPQNYFWVWRIVLLISCRYIECRRETPGGLKMCLSLDRAARLLSVSVLAGLLLSAVLAFGF